MSRAAPSMVALLGLLAVAGYQHKDKLAQMLGDAQAKARERGPFGGDPALNSGAGAGGDGLGGLGGLGGLLGGSNFSLGGGLNELVNQFKNTGHAEAAESWVKPGPNRGLAPDQVEQAIGADNLAELSRRTGLSREELVTRLATNIPEAVDKYTPDGKIPPEDEVYG